ncbi:hypothetical protein 010DV004_276 [Bacillus phage 010DV004]|nr:hypothetical protein 010DV004_11 [Bacillus phage 010DV004]QZA69229.1 hypothetical protein 010DV005_11 [Bacillus phage 010DV005]QZA69797.1 hypothetical protein 043JT007_11 [Bacillus phage 043JT007]QZA69208.1 hypothetical protein 010DV004_276 [Bacillus phage 010DV004]QZA69489.1 hypothetical protein 010DV005_277 [Bacillus phage 010DV005]
MFKNIQTIDNRIGARITELNPVYDSRKSFYGKAMVLEDGNTIALRSYDTIVAEIKDGKAEVYGTYSMTTMRHIKDFLYQNGFEVGTKKFIEKTYIKG